MQYLKLLIRFKNSLFLFIIILTLPYLQSCSGSISDSTDDSLKEFLSGSWTSENYETIIFNEDNTFTDSIFSEIPYQKTTALLPLYVINGKYSVEDGIIYFKHAKFNYLRDAADPKIKTYSKILYPRTVRIENEDMFLQEIQILRSQDGIDTTLQGKWVSTNWVCTFDRFNNPQFYGGMYSEIFQFDTINLEVKYTGKYLFDTSLKNITEQIGYSYNPPRIYFDREISEPASFFGISALIEKGEMRWISKDPVLFHRHNAE